MIGRLFIFASVLSLLLFASTAVLWARSYWQRDTVWVRAGSRFFAMGSGDGQIGVVIINDARGPSDRHLGWEHHPDGSPLSDAIDSSRAGQWTKWGFGYLWNVPVYGMTEYAFVAPCWFMLIVFAVLPALALRGWKRRRAARIGCCRKCGYDLRATPDRCPECGTVPRQPSAANGVLESSS